MRNIRFSIVSIAVVTVFAGNADAYADRTNLSGGWTPFAVDWSSETIFPPFGHDVMGLYVSGYPIDMDGERSVYGVQFNLLAGLAKTMYGTQVGLFNNAHDGYAAQMGIANGMEDGFGIQAGLINNSSANGLQIGFDNSNDNRFAIQVGVFNNLPLFGFLGGVSNRGGVQIGLANSSSDGGHVQIGLFNFAEASNWCLQIGLLCYRGDDGISPLIGWHW